ncbi:MAG: DNA-protecting protein DprA [Candidatus Pacebacteria bacterium CG_4_10_14_3_um_filter_34_15]|nr:DNA-protecting protein DprA [Candidatus Pacearchaeota archaeon]NCQ65393.1 DNA-protecting protein DprA [Candidatus Paceibacterota bacterium]OIO44225.1 MAG: DNA protecting protein DprA [Candidatus Pacebacteria bacterium CG1_02_43_31]PIQ80777.1 MAG: DNA-protecting protein DprA [Candidatus Pacebacteria bacterium CG11_big_fil_rev_8_21_14_0_20_34_55]PIX81388.1 MAG: DNA-protecting protein DprA [Candidatus Pacebacteria bacterium CG_4_10_14_3_um_filter_34_15]PJC43883.1 MAG: DNA-protecting protein Dp
MSLEQTIINSKKHFTLKDKKFVLLLLSVTGVGRKTAKNIIYLLIKYELKFEDFWVNKFGIWQKSQLSNKSIENIKKIKTEHNNYSLYKDIIKKDIRVIAFWEEEYPKLLKQCDDFPVILFVKGNAKCLQNDSIGVVGTRRITSYGRLATKKIVEDLVLEGFSIVSGFMYGVDLCAHLEAMKNGGITIAVLGFGFDHMYPRSHTKYFDQVIKSGGCFITEFPPNVEPAAGNFPSRNRIVAGISKGVVVIEAAKKSGSHITAECAVNEGREVFAVPGPINNPFSEGTKWLINQGATMITSGHDVIEQFKGVCNISSDARADSSSNDLLKNLSKIQRLIIEELRGGPQEIDNLADTIKIDVNEIIKEITLLEISDIVNVIGNRLSIKL